MVSSSSVPFQLIEIVSIVNLDYGLDNLNRQLFKKLLWLPILTYLSNQTLSCLGTRFPRLLSSWSPGCHHHPLRTFSSLPDELV